MEASRQLEFERKAVEVVERLLDVPVDETFFLDAVKYIEPRHYDDVIEERSIISLCGYPLCCHKLENVPKQKYHISLAQKKVYDLTLRKKFCSNACFKCSAYYASQLSTTPVWAREGLHIPLVHLLPMNSSTTPSSTVRQTETTSKDYIVKAVSTNSYLSKVSEQKVEKVQASQSDSKASICLDPSATDHDTNAPSSLSVSGASPEVVVTHIKGSTVEIVWDVLSSWCTADTIILLTNPLLSTQSETTDGLSRDDENATRTVSGGEMEQTRTEGFKRKGCSHSKSQKDISTSAEKRIEISDEEMMEKLRRFQVNVKTGKFIDEVAVTNNRSAAVVDMESENAAAMPAVEELGSGSVVIKEHNLEDSLDLDPVLPLVDSRSQMAIRQRIVLNQLNKAYRLLLVGTELSIGGFSQDLNNIVRTFRLQSNNITLKPSQWKLISIVLLYSLHTSVAVNNAALSTMSYRLQERLCQCIEGLEVNSDDMTSLISIFGIQVNSMEKLFSKCCTT